MTDRIRELRQQSLDAIPSISAERALLITRFYQDPEIQLLPIPVRRAKAFEYILRHKTICINPGELIVGERGPAPKATPTYPEICLHSLDDLVVLDTRPKVAYQVSDEVKEAYRDTIIPYWKGKSNRERIMGLMAPEWLEAYHAGVFTEFQEQRAPGHTVCGGKIYQKGMLDLITDIHEAQQSLDFQNDPEAQARQDELTAMEIAANALILYAHRHATALEELACSLNFEYRQSNIDNRISEILQLISICRRVPAYPPRTFHEALQYYWFVHVGVITEVNPWDSFNPGRLDQHLYPFYRKEIDEGTLTKEQATELLQSFWIKFNNQPAPPKVGVTALESNTYTDFALINVGGLTPDGSDGSNDLSYLILDVIREMRILQPSSMVQLSHKNPDELVRKALGITKTGFGQPSYFNTDAIIQELVNQGKSPEDARNGGASGCVEAGAFGTEAYFLTGYFNLTKILEVTLHNGINPSSGKLIGLRTGEPASFQTFDSLVDAYARQIAHFAGIKISGNRVIEETFARHIPVPFLSLVIDDCIRNGRDYNAGGARYNTSYIQGVGMGSATDCLTAIRYHVFDKKTTTLPELIEALNKNFEGFSDLRFKLVYETPKYGNDDPYADQHAQMVFDAFHQAVDGKPTWRQGGTCRINLLPTTSHVYFGRVTGAMPDGRKAGEPLSEGISPVQGADTHGPTAVLKSSTTFNHLKTGGTLLNQKFTPSFFEGEDAFDKLTALIRGYFRMNGHHIQFNVVTAETLRDAQKRPEKYRDLIVRVAGYSDYFNDLGKDLQDEIIRRTAQQ